MALSPTTPADLIARYHGDPLAFLTVYSPAVQEDTYRVAADEAQSYRVFCGIAPSLDTVSEAFSRAVAESWLIAQLNDLNEWASTRERLTPAQMDRIAKVIAARYGYLNLAELALFFFLFKAGEYGKFYSAVDGMAITDALRNKFIPYREAARQRAYEQRNAALNEQEAAAHDLRLRQQYAALTAE